MTAFFRFILTVLVLGIVVNLTIVMLANARSMREQEENRREERATFKDILNMVDGRGRRAYITVESQEVTWKGDVSRSSLLVRRLFLAGTPAVGAPSEVRRPPLNRVVIQGDQLHMDGLLLQFGPNFTVDVDGHDALRGKKLVYFGHVYGSTENPADAFSFEQAPAIPVVTRIYPQADQPTFFEMQLWQKLWDVISNETWAARADVKAVQLKPAVITVKNGHTYAAYMSTEGMSLEEDNTPGLRMEMISEAQSMKLPAAP